MAMETAAMDPAARRTKVMHWIDVSTTAVFGLEALLKVGEGDVDARRGQGSMSSGLLMRCAGLPSWYTTHAHLPLGHSSTRVFARLLQVVAFGFRPYISFNTNKVRGPSRKEQGGGG